MRIKVWAVCSSKGSNVLKNRPTGLIFEIHLQASRSNAQDNPKMGKTMTKGAASDHVTNDAYSCHHELNSVS